jgi:competence protein ComEA
VRRPGLYRLREGARIADAVTRAGGPSRRADMAMINLAAPVADGMQIIVPARVAAPGGATPLPGSGAPTGNRVSLSSATVEQLDSLPGIGPVTAQKIVDWRTAHGPFRSVDALDDVPGIGPARLEQLRDLVTP